MFRPESESEGELPAVDGGAFDSVFPLAGPDVFLCCHADGAGCTNPKDVFGRQIVVSKFLAEMPRVDNCALVKALVEPRPGSVPGKRCIFRLLAFYQQLPRGPRGFAQCPQCT